MKLRLVYFSPLNSISPDIMTYGENLLPHLINHTEVSLFVENVENAKSTKFSQIPAYPCLAYGANRWAYDASIYHLDNHPCYADIYRTFLAYPGIVALHSFDLYELVAGITPTRSDRSGFLREVRYSLDVEDARQAKRAISRDKQIENCYLNSRVMDLNLGLIVHSDYMRRMVQRLSPHAMVAKVDIGVSVPSLPSTMSEMQSRQSLGLSPDDLVITSFLTAKPRIRIKSILQAFYELLKAYPQARLLLAGESLSTCDNDSLIQKLGLENKVLVTGSLSSAEYKACEVASGIAVQLHYPAFGEASISTLRALAIGLPTIVSDTGWAAELPDAICRKVSPGEREIEVLYRHLTQLAEDVEMRQYLGKKARNYVARHHKWEQAAADYLAFIQAVLEYLYKGVSGPRPPDSYDRNTTLRSTEVFRGTDLCL
jgi:glycosyltransferase involved in cell wall biosynthesis